MPVDAPCLPADVKSHLRTRIIGRRMYYVPEVDSTNRLAKELANDGERDGTAVVTDFQSAGRGRWARSWQSPPGKNLLFSLILTPERDTADILPLTLAFSLGVARILREVLDIEVGVKWPNDVVTQEGKICGILSEGSSQGGKSTTVVTGIGINVNMEAVDVSDGARATSCYSLTGTTHERPRLLAAVLGSLDNVYEEFLRAGFAYFLDDYRAAVTRLGTSVRFRRGGVDFSGEVEDVQPDGGLVIRTSQAGPVVLYDEEIRRS